ncbi:MAG: hypothetical protein WCR42_16305 [bacterium]
MEEILELRINMDYAHLLFREDEGKNLGDTVKLVRLASNDPRSAQVSKLYHKVLKVSNDLFFFGWKIIRQYTEKEFDNSSFYQFLIKKTFEPTGEDCGTIYDESTACEICGAHRTQVGDLKLRKSSLPKLDIARTIGGEIIVSEKFVKLCQTYKISGADFKNVYSSKNLLDYKQLVFSNGIDLSQKTKAGVNPFDYSTEPSEASTLKLDNGMEFDFPAEVYKCSLGHTIGLNLLTEAFVKDNPLIRSYDFLKSNQEIGVKRGYLIPEPIYFCSKKLREMIINEKLTGFNFEIAHIEES